MVADAATIVFCVTEYSTQGQVYLVYTHVPATLLGAAAGLSWISMLHVRAEFVGRGYLSMLPPTCACTCWCSLCSTLSTTAGTTS